MTSSYHRSHNCGALSLQNNSETVHLSGWVHRRRDHGGIIFIDLRDKQGLTQIVFDPSQSKQLHAIAQQLRQEWVITITGTVRPRGEGLSNPKLKTGEIEVLAKDAKILSKAKTPPFEISPDQRHKNEELRLKYRYLDMRQGEIIERLQIRDRIQSAARSFLSDQSFIEVQTPILCKSTPEGARDYLVPSRVHEGQFYALPQSPQLFKQLLMVGGLDRYYQIAPCFRDEDLRADRQAEFYQIDLEMSFGKREEIFSLIEQLFANIFEAIDHPQKKSIPPSFDHLTYDECIRRFGTDKPDLRFGLEFIDVESHLKESSFTIAHQALDSGDIARAITVSSDFSFTRKQIDEATKLVQGLGLSGLAWLKVGEIESSTSQAAASGPLSRFFTAEQTHSFAAHCGAKSGDLILVGFAPKALLNGAMDHLRRHLGKTLGLIDPKKFCFCWVKDFPLFEKDPQSGELAATHHAFTAPHPDDLSLLDSDPLSVRAMHYDLVLNGYELGSGSERIHDSAIQSKIFSMMKLSEEEIQERFGFFVEALEYGTPPHLGIALGIERIVMLLSGTSNIRDVVAFPKTQSAADLMMRSPSPVDSEQLKELHLKLR